MSVLKFDETSAYKVNECLERKIIHGDNLMTVILDFSNGPWSEPEPLHSHFHEQTSYVVEGEILFICENEPSHRLKAGDAFFVSSDKKHGIQLLTEKVRLIDNFTPVREDFL